LAPGQEGGQPSQRRSAQISGLNEARSGALVDAPAADAAATFAVALEQALTEMPPKRRACAVMCLVVGMSVHEAGEALGIADGTVRKHLDEARRDLRVAWKPDA